MASKDTTNKTQKKKAQRTSAKSEERAKRKAEKAEQQLEFERKHRIHDEIGAIVCIAIGVFLVFAMATDKVGVVGDVFSKVLTGLFGPIAKILPYYIGVYGLLLLFKLVKPMAKRSLLLFILIFLLLDVVYGVKCVEGIATAKFNWQFVRESYQAAAGTAQIPGMVSAGAWGNSISLLLVKIIGSAGTYIVGIAGMLVFLLLAIRKPMSEVASNAKSKADAMKKEREEQKAKEEAERAKLEADKPVQIELDPVTYNPKEEKKKKGILSLVGDKGLFAHKDNGEELPEDMHVEDIPEPDAEYDDVDADTSEPKLKYGIEEPYFVPAGMGLVSSEEMGENETPVSYTSATGELKASDLFENERKTPETKLTRKEPDEDAMAAFAGRKTASEATQETPPAKPYEGAPKPYKFPPVSLLAQNKQAKNVKDSNSLLENSRKLEEALKTFNVEATVTNVTKGPTVTRYELQPQPGVKVSQIKNLADDIALTLAAKSLRIEAPIPGKSAIGIEIENEHINTITFRECIESREFQTATSKVAAAIGKDIGGSSIICNLKDMPHLLIAGATGAGKSVCVNSIIMSILYKAKPEEVKLILIDPKKVELSNYNGIPHLLTPVVTDTSKAAAALSWCVAEMMRRYQLFADEGVRDMKSYNETMKANQEPEKVLPFIVIVIDELADLMMAAGKQVEPAICRIGQLARAAGMHMVIATQSPRVDVITGLIKANIPSRIALMCSQRVDSMVILDEPGAEKLVGKGDMLFLGAGASKPTRIQGCFVSDDEINKTVEYIIKNNVAGTYSTEIQASMDKPAGDSDAGDDDEGIDASLLQEAIQCVVQQQQCSVSMLQRKFRIGYNHAARLVDAMEARGIIGPADGTRPRKVLKTEADYNAMGADEE